MTDREREHWDARYAEGEYTPRTEAAPFLASWLPWIPKGRALDVACGAGRNALELAAAGFDVTAVDVSPVAIDMARAAASQRGLEVDWVVADLDSDPLPGDGYDLVTVVRYRNPRLWSRLADAIAPDGWILVEHHLRTHRDAAGPGTDEFRLAPGELLGAFGRLRIVHYSESVEPADLHRGEYVIARLAACAGDPGW